MIINSLISATTLEVIWIRSCLACSRLTHRTKYPLSARRLPGLISLIPQPPLEASSLGSSIITHTLILYCFHWTQSLPLPLLLLSVVNRLIFSYSPVHVSLLLAFTQKYIYLFACILIYISCIITMKLVSLETSWMFVKRVLHQNLYHGQLLFLSPPFFNICPFNIYLLFSCYISDTLYIRRIQWWKFCILEGRHNSK